MAAHDRALSVALDGPRGIDGDVCYYVVPIYKMGRKPFRLTERFARSSGVGTVNKSERIIAWDTGVEQHFRSADEPGDIVSESPIDVTFDEAGRIPDEAFDYIDPARRVHDAMRWNFGTPRGKTRFYEEHLRGLDEDGNSPLLSGKPPVDPLYLTFKAPSWIAPWWTPEAIEDARRQMSDAMFRQEIMAEFLDSAAGVFGDFEHYSTGGLEEPTKDGVYVMGVDLAKHEDFTAVRVFRVNAPGVLAKEVAFWRGHQMPWRQMLAQIKGISHRFNGAAVVVDATGLGGPVCEQMREMGIPVTEEFTFTPTSKEELINNLVAKIQTAQVELLRRDVDPVAFQEMADFQAEPVVSRSGNVHTGVRFRYGHAPGKHDDTVIARALALRAIANRVTVNVW